MSFIDTSSIPEQSHPLFIEKPAERSNESQNDNLQQYHTLIQQTNTKHVPYQQRIPKATNTNCTPSICSATDRTPCSLIELKQQRLAAAADRRKRIIARIVTIVGLLIILLCAGIVTLTLKMAPKIDELVRSKGGPHQLIPMVSRASTLTITTTPISTIYQENSTLNATVTEKILFRTHRRP